MIQWASKKSLTASVADVPDNWLVRFAAAQPNDIRKFGSARNSTLLYRSEAVLAAIEDGRYFRTEAAAAAVGGEA